MCQDGSPGMKPRNQVSRSAIELIKRFEGYRRASARLPDGRWTIGYGHTLTAREGAEVSEQDAEALLIYDLIAISHSVNEWVFTPLNQNQFDALVAFAFNIGPESFRHSSVLRRLNEGALIQAACAMELWRKAEFEGEKIVVDALVRRRSAEKALFLTPVNGWIPAPSPVLRPNLDLDAEGVVPIQAPTALHAPLEGALAVVELDEARQEKLQRHGPEDPAAPATAAAAAVSTRLSAIFSDAAEEAPPRLMMEEDGSVLAAFPQREAAFDLTQPDEDFAPAEVFREPKLELVAANESEPTLFEPAGLEGDHPEAPQPTEDLFVSRPKKAKKKAGVAPAALLATAGLALFGGCLYWAMNAAPAHGADGLNPTTIVWLGGVVGVALVGVAVYLILDRLGRPSLESAEAGE